jgi:phage terminase large subunit-like protein
VSKRPSVPSRWQEYGAGTEVEHFAWWCETFLVQSVDQFAGQPLRLEPWQLEFMGEALAVGEDGQPFWSSIALVVARKNGKTALLAAYALWRLLNDEGHPEILLAAASDRQAGRLFEQVLSYVRRNRELARQLHLREYMGEIARSDGGGKILRMASDPSTLYGYSPSLVVCDELHAWTKPNHRRAWSALTTAGGARQSTQTFTISTAGEAQDRETGILGRLIDKNELHGQMEKQPGLTISRDLSAATLLYNYSAPTANPREIAAMKLANPASWIGEAYLARQAENPELTDSEVLQLHGCVWAAGVNAWLSAAAWEACYDEGAEIPADSPVYVGVDVGLVHDSTAVALAWKRGDGRIVVQAHVWAAKEDAVAHETVPGGIVDLEAVEEYLLDLKPRFKVREIVYDPRFFARSAEIISRGGLLVAPLEQNSRHMADAYESWYAAVLEGRVAHAGDPVLTAHVLATAAQKTDRGWKVSKIRNQQRIDAHVACAMAHARAEQAKHFEPAFAWA